MADLQQAAGQKSGAGAASARLPPATEGELLLHNFQFVSGDSLPALRLHYRTLGQLQRDERGVVRNAVLVLHGTGGSGAHLMVEEFGGELFGSGQPLDAGEYFIVLPDNIGHGQSSKPSDGLHARFPRFGYRDMLVAQHRLLTDGLQVNHLRLVMGTSMGGMHTWLWGEEHPDFMDALLPLASLPAQICARNRVWRRAVTDAIRHDPQWCAGDYQRQPQSLRTAAQIMFLMGSNPVLRWQQMPTLHDSDAVLDAAVDAALMQLDANDTLFQFEASRDYDPGPRLEQIRAPLLALNWADDLINPPEIGILEHEIRRVSQGRAIVLPRTSETRGHETQMMAAGWKHHLLQLLQSSPHR
ncbi:MAG TPA: alpha/beta fold hydrolase [Steroidobacteraceae bacterium]|jgi:homoserine O-acetyltransferase